MIKILLIEDHGIVREGLKRILADLPGGASIGDAANANDGLKMLSERTWDVVLLDLQLPGKSGSEALRQIVHEYPGLPVLVLSMYPEDQFAVRMLKAGAAGYLQKEAAHEELVAAVLKIVRGGKVFSEKIAAKLVDGLRNEPGRPAHENLSDREFQIFRLIASGKTQSEIADSLNISAKTVGTYRARILEKMALSGTAELAIYAVNHSLIV